VNENNRVVLRPYIKADISVIRNIYGYYVKNSAVTFELEVPSEKQIFEKFEIMQKANHPIIIATINNEIVGFAYASTYRPREAYRFTCENAIYIDKDMRGIGLGDLLLGELLKQAKEFGFNQMIAIVTAGTDASIALHKKHGFEILGEFPELGYKFEKWHNITHMQKKL